MIPPHVQWRLESESEGDLGFSLLDDMISQLVMLDRQNMTGGRDAGIYKVE